MDRLYKYTGTVGSYRVEHRDTFITRMDMIVHDITDDSKAPARIEAFGGLADYIKDLHDTDREEKYLQVVFVYDANLFLHYIIVPGYDSRIPAKLICAAEVWDEVVETFGPQDYIDDTRPGRMSPEEFNRFVEWKMDHDLYNYAI